MKPDIKFRNSLTPTETQYWLRYGITASVLYHYEVLPVEWFKTSSGYKVNSSEANPIFAYKISDDCYKIYQPLSRKFKFSWLGKKPQDYVFGQSTQNMDKKSIIITGGEKDVLTLASRGYNALALNSETAKPSPYLIEQLQKTYEAVYIMYDIDATGRTQSNLIAHQYPILINVQLPDTYNGKKYGTDVSDFVAHVGFDEASPALDTILSKSYKERTMINTITPHKQDISENNTINKLLDIQKQIGITKSKRIDFKSAILLHGENPVIFPRTINVIQGKAGVHKSRLAETICAALIKKKETDEEHLDFVSQSDKEFAICYVDTERNWSDQFPYALQQIQLKAGYTIEDTPENFDFLSLVDISREQRLEALSDYIEISKEKYISNYVIILDVLTDCLCSFNDAAESMKLIDILNSTINNYDVTFICLIHENPGVGNKARGHLGTEIMNKASTVIQCSMDKDTTGHLVKVDFLKCRSTRRYDAFYAKFCELTKSLVLANESEVKEAAADRQQKAPTLDVGTFLVNVLDTELPKKKVMQLVMDEFSASKRTVESRLKDIVENEMRFTTSIGEYRILKKLKDRATNYYRVAV